MSPNDSFGKSMEFQSHSDSFPTKTHRLSHTDTHFLSVWGIWSARYFGVREFHSRISRLWLALEISRSYLWTNVPLVTVPHSCVWEWYYHGEEFCPVLVRMEPIWNGISIRGNGPFLNKRISMVHQCKKKLLLVHFYNTVFPLIEIPFLTDSVLARIWQNSFPW